LEIEELSFLYDRLYKFRFDISKIKATETKFTNYLNSLKFLISIDDYILVNFEEAILSIEYLYPKQINALLVKNLNKKQYTSSEESLTRWEQILNTCENETHEFYKEIHAVISQFENYIIKEKEQPFSFSFYNLASVNSIINNRNDRQANLYWVANQNYNDQNDKKRLFYKHENGSQELSGIHALYFNITQTEIKSIIVNKNKLVKRLILNIKKDIQRAEVLNGIELRIYMHRHFDPEIIIFNTTEEAIEIADKINSYRNSSPSFENRRSR
jgi:hypothetical protein